MKAHENTAPKITSDRKDPVPSKIVIRELYKAGFQGRTAIRKPYENKSV